MTAKKRQYPKDEMKKPSGNPSYVAGYLKGQSDLLEKLAPVREKLEDSNSLLGSLQYGELYEMVKAQIADNEKALQVFRELDGEVKS